MSPEHALSLFEKFNEAVAGLGYNSESDAAWYENLRKKVGSMNSSEAYRYCEQEMENNTFNYELVQLFLDVDGFQTQALGRV